MRASSPAGSTGRPAVSKMTRRDLRPAGALALHEQPAAVRAATMAVSTAPAGRGVGAPGAGRRGLRPAPASAIERTSPPDGAAGVSTAGVVVAMSGSGVASACIVSTGGAPSSPPGSGCAVTKAGNRPRRAAPLPAVRPGLRKRRALHPLPQRPFGAAGHPPRTSGRRDLRLLRAIAGGSALVAPTAAGRPSPEGATDYVEGASPGTTPTAAALWPPPQRSQPERQLRRARLSGPSATQNGVSYSVPI